MEPWGISGPTFVLLYVAGLAAALIAAGLGRRRIRSLPRPAREAPADVPELAFLAGGPMRAAEAAVAGLVERGALRVTRRRKISATGTAPADPVEAAVLDMVRGHREKSVAATVVGAARRPEITRLGEHLVARGLLVDRGVGVRKLWRAALPLFAVFAIGLVRWLNGLALDRPVGILTVLLLVTAAAAVAMVWPPKVWRTNAGNAALAARSPRRRSAVHGAGGADAVPDSSGAAALVAMGGFAAFPDPSIRSALGPSPSSGSPSSSDGGSGGSSCGGSSCGGSSGGSSCGGGGGGGGGCGG